MDIDFKNELNEEQYKAVTASDGPVLVLAAAGTGKTRTLVHRVAYLVNKEISPERILLLTFTNKASREMLERAQKLVGPGVSGIWGGTFHHMSNRILRRHAPVLGYRHDFTILDHDDSKSMVSSIVKDRKLKDKEFPKPEVLLGMISASMNMETDIQALLQGKYQDYANYSQEIISIRDEYIKKKKTMDAMDFDDLIVNCLKVFRENRQVLEKYQEQFLHVLVDEYQDTNCIQSELVDKIAGKHRNLMVVGDDFQSIYSWRGADYKNILDFPKKYADAQVYKLETNYRSIPEILNVANVCIAGNIHQFQKTLRATRPGGKKPQITKMYDGGQQARYVAQLVKHLVNSGVPASEIAVLYRAHYQSMELQLEMNTARIKYAVTSGVRFFEQAHIKDVCSLLRIIENPCDEISFVRLMRMLPGIGERTALKIWNKIGGSFDASDAGHRKMVEDSLKPDSKAIWAAIDKIIIAYREDGLSDDPGEVIYQFLSVFYGRYMADTYQDYDRRAEDINEMILYMANYENAQQFLSDIALLTNLDAEDENVGGVEDNAVRLSTVHQAKGLEWRVVILAWMTEGMFPAARTINESPDGESEERRLFYVAITRAKDDLFLCVPEVRRMHDGGFMHCVPSRFIEELPSNLTRHHNLGFI